MELSIIINHYKTPHLLKLCLEYLNKNLSSFVPQYCGTSEDKPEIEIIVVDSETREETQEMLTEFFPSVIFIPFKENIGFGKTVNAGLKRAKGKYVLILNADIIVHKKETIPLTLEYLEKHQDVGLLGPQLLNFNNSIQNSCFRFYTPAVILCRRTFLGRTKWGRKIIDRFLMNDADKKSPVETDWLMGSALLTTKKAVEKVGLFDERFFMYFEDVDWCRRFWQAGYKVVYFPIAQMYHYHMQASKKGFGIFDFFLSEYARTHLVSAIKYFWKWREE